MFDLLTKPGSPRPSRSKFADIAIEPHVKTFGITQQAINRFAIPFKMLTLGLSALMVAAVAWWMLNDSTIIIKATVWTLMLITPFYLTGMIFYLRFFSREQGTRLEIDQKYQLIQYKSRGANLLFRIDQVRSCEVTISTFLPFRLEYTSLHLAGGTAVHVSNLIVDPVEMVSLFDIPYQVHRKVFNSLPRK